MTYNYLLYNLLFIIFFYFIDNLIKSNEKAFFLISSIFILYLDNNIYFF